MHSSFIVPDEEETLNMLYFTKTEARTDANILMEHVIVSKDKHGARGSI